MTHADVRAHLSEYLEGELALRQRAILDAHLDSCPPCRDALSDLRAAVRLLHVLGETPEPAGRISDVVMERLRDGEAQPSWWSRLVDALEVMAQPRVVRPAALAALGAAILVMTRPEPLHWLTAQLGATDETQVIGTVSPTAGRLLGSNDALRGEGPQPLAWQPRLGLPRTIEISRNSVNRHMREVIGSTIVAPTFGPSPMFRSTAPTEPFRISSVPRIVEVTPASMQR